MLSGKDDSSDFDELDIPGVLNIAFGNVMKEEKNDSILKAFTSNPFCGCNYFFPPSLPIVSGVMLAADENTAIQCILEDMNISQ